MYLWFEVEGLGLRPQGLTGVKGIYIYIHIMCACKLGLGFWLLGYKDIKM